MNTPNTTRVINISSLALTLAMVICLPAQAESTAAVQKKSGEAPNAMEGCHSMHAEKQKMLDDIKAQDAVLTEELAKMNSAPDDKKVGLMATLVTHIVEQRIAMDERRAKMEDMMMQHMQMRTEAISHEATPKDSKKK